MRTFVLKLKAEIKLTLNNKVVWSNQKKCETNSQKFKLRAPARTILVFGKLETSPCLHYLVKFKTKTSKTKKMTKGEEDQTILKKHIKDQIEVIRILNLIKATMQ